MYKKINIYLNKEYLCSTNAYRTCKECKQAILNHGFITWATIPEDKTAYIKPNDKIICRFAK